MKTILLASCLLFLFSAPSFAQLLRPVPPFPLLSSGYGATAEGMGGAFVAIASDLSAIYWNPAGLAQQPGWQIYADYMHQGNNSEDFAAEVTPDRLDSRQRFSVSGNRPDSFAVSYSLKSRT